MQEINIKVTTENKGEFEVESHVHVKMNRNELSQCIYEILKELSRLDELSYIGASLKLAGELNH